MDEWRLVCVKRTQEIESEGSRRPGWPIPNRWEKGKREEEEDY